MPSLEGDEVKERKKKQTNKQLTIINCDNVSVR